MTPSTALAHAVSPSRLTLVSASSPGRGPQGLEPASGLDIGALTTPAFIIDESTLIHDSNARGDELRAIVCPGSERLDRDLPSLRKNPSLFIIRLAEKDRFLVVYLAPVVAFRDRLACAVDAWGLTPGQARVLELLVRGASNLTIAELRGCAPRTVEVHVTAILDKSGCESRAQVIARFWTDW